MKKTSNKILAALLIAIALMGIVFILIVKVKGTGENLNKTDVTINDEIVSVRISYAAKKADIEEIRINLLEEKNISIDYSESEFNSDGEIEKLRITVDCNDGFEGSLKASEFELKMGFYGFERDYSEDSDEPFTIGELKLLVK